ncbi:hypothetical protein BDQ17DRAFT_369773 [Cyathus striatus]|nr:hypothetical protein BDQ17DRAFT_369773 [Cyathus striatus]
MATSTQANTNVPQKRPVKIALIGNPTETLPFMSLFFTEGRKAYGWTTAGDIREMTTLTFANSYAGTKFTT